MKSNIRFIFFLVLITGIASELKSQQYPCTVIDVRGSRYGDSMWLFTVEGTTDGFDNGWDGYKMFGSTLAPQIFAVGSDLQNYQVYTSSNIHGVNISFTKGEDSQYTLYFKHYDLSLGYQQLYLLDKKTMVVTDIYQDGSQYNFTCEVGDSEDRFSVLAYLEAAVSPDEGTGDGTETETGDETADGTSPGDITDVDDDSNDSDSDTISDNKNPKGKGLNKRPDHPKGKSFKVFAVNGDIMVDNPLKLMADVVVINARSGRIIKKDIVPAEKISKIRTNLKKGAYIVNVSAGNKQKGTTIIF